MLAASEAARRSVLLVEEPDRGTLVVRGPDRATWLNGIVTADVAKVAPGHGAFSLVLSKTGKVLSDLYVVASDSALFLSVVPGASAELASYFDRMLVMEDAELEDVTEGFVWLTLHGPRSSALARKLALASGGAEGSIDRTGLGGAALVVPRARLGDLPALAAAEDADSVFADAGAWELLRIERGVGRFGTDYGTDDNPHEAGLDQVAVSWSKGCYLGQEVVCMQGMRGKLKRRLVALALTGEAPPSPGMGVELPDGTRVGEVTSAAFSPRLGHAVALARLGGGALEGAPLLSVAGGPARLVARPESAPAD